MAGRRRSVRPAPRARVPKVATGSRPFRRQAAWYLKTPKRRPIRSRGSTTRRPAKHRTAHTQGPRTKRHLSAAARRAESLRLKGQRHPHKGSHAKRRPMTAAQRKAESARMTGKRHPHKGHRMSSASRAKISKALTGRKRGRRG